LVGDKVTPYELVEFYNSDTIGEIENLGTSYMVARVANFHKSIFYNSISQYDQTLVVVVVPEKSLDRFAVELRDENGRILEQSSSKDGIGVLSGEVKAGQAFSVSVRVLSSGHFLSKSYRLVVIGSGLVP
jgi:hypothetical protein